MTPRPGFINNMAVTYNGVLVDPGRSIRRCRTNLMMSQAEVAKKASLSPSYLSRLELNKAGVASMATYAKVARAMGITLDQLFGF